MILTHKTQISEDNLTKHKTHWRGNNMEITKPELKLEIKNFN